MISRRRRGHGQMPRALLAFPRHRRGIVAATRMRPPACSPAPRRRRGQAASRAKGELRAPSVHGRETILSIESAAFASRARSATRATDPQPDRAPSAAPPHARTRVGVRAIDARKDGPIWTASRRLLFRRRRIGRCRRRFLLRRLWMVGEDHVLRSVDVNRFVVEWAEFDPARRAARWRKLSEQHADRRAHAWYLAGPLSPLAGRRRVSGCRMASCGVAFPSSTC